MYTTYILLLYYVIYYSHLQHQRKCRDLYQIHSPHKDLPCIGPAISWYSLRGREGFPVPDPVPRLLAHRGTSSQGSSRAAQGLSVPPASRSPPPCVPPALPAWLRRALLTKPRKAFLRDKRGRLHGQASCALEQSVEQVQLERGGQSPGASASPPASLHSTGCGRVGQMEICAHFLTAHLRSAFYSL